MSHVPKPPDEAERLRALHRLPSLDGAPQPWLDRITQLASTLLRTPMAAVSVIEGRRQLIKAGCGFPQRSIRRDEAFCAHTILDTGVMIVPDTLCDERFADHALVVEEPHLRSYAGAPLMTKDGHTVGALCVLDTVPRDFTEEQIGALEALAILTIREWEDFDEDHALVNAEANEAELRCRTLVENAAEGIWRSEPGGRLVSANPAMAHLLGYGAPEDLLAAVPNLRALYAQPGRREELEGLIRERGVVLGFESEVRRRDGTVTWISENVRVIFDQRDQALRHAGTLEDISQRRSEAAEAARRHEELETRVKERTVELAAANGGGGALHQEIAQREHAEAAARRSESKFRALLENAQDLTSIIDATGIVLYSSPSVQPMLGYTPEEMAGRNAMEFVHPDDQGAVHDQLDAIVRQGREHVRVELRFRHRSGEWRLLESIGTLAPADSPVVGIVVNTRDVTERHRIEQGLANHARLQQAVARLSQYALTCTDEQGMFDVAASVVVEALQCDLSSVNELLPGGGELLMRSGVGWPAGVAGTAILTNWRAVSGTTGSEALVIDQLENHQLYTVRGHSPEAPPPVSAASVLIQTGGELFGTVCALSSRPRKFVCEDVTFLQTVADLLGAVIGRERHREALRRIEERYQRIVANTPGMVYQFLLRMDGTMALPFVSEGSREVYGMEPAALTANPQLVLGAVHPEDQASLYRSLTQSAASLRPWHWEGRFVLPIGTKWVQGASRPQRLSNGDVLWDGIIMDVSERRRAQEALREAKEEAERASNAKSDFLSRMSHELRTPLNAILGFSQLLELEDLGSARNQSVAYIIDAGRRLLELVDETLDLSRIETGRVTLDAHPIDLIAALRETARLTESLAQSRQIDFLFPGPGAQGVALGDASRVNLVLLNLVTHAVKRAPFGGAVRFACRAVGAGRVRLSITDRGPAVSDDERAQLFSTFDRLGASAAGRQGVGLGLAIAKRLVEAMGGTIGVHSGSAAGGATFFLELAAASSAAPAAEPAPASPRRELPAAPAGGSNGNARSVVLYLAGNDADASLVKQILERRPAVQLQTALEPGKGLEAAARLRPRLILLDADACDAAGIRRRLRQDSRTRSTPVMTLSAVDGAASGVGGLRKPLDAVTFLQAVDQALAAPPVA